MSRKKTVDKYEELGIKLWEKFESTLQNLGFIVSSHNSADQGRGAIAFKKDTFVPIIRLCYWYYGNCFSYGDTGFMSIHVEDRNGNKILDGNTVAIYSVDVKKDANFEEIETRFDKMLEEVLANYGVYNRENRLDSAFKELEEDRRDF